jgi:hypothetical protein
MEPPQLLDLISVYRQLSEEQQALVLCRLSAQLTVDARVAYPEATPNLADAPDEEQSFKLLRRFNELQHKIAFHLLRLLLHDAQRYPDEVFIRIIIEMGGALTLRNLDEAIRKASP